MYISTFNVFPSVPPSTNEYELRTQRISTKLFIIAFSISLIILLLYNSLNKITKTVTVEAPTFMEYAHLNATYSQTLNCPCSKISINYGKFLHGNYTMHQVCTSTFINQTWIRHLSNANETEFLTTICRCPAAYAFQALKSFCNLLHETISNGLIQFYSNQYVSASVVPKTLFESEIESLTNQLRSSLTNNFLLFLATIRDANQVNALVSALQNNYHGTSNGDKKILLSTSRMRNCSCTFPSKCIFPSFQNVNRNPRIYYKRCIVIELLLQSNLECFYNQQCINDLQHQISSSSPINVPALDKSLPSVYSINETIEKLLDKLMIEQWNISATFENYYNQCQPIKCVYTSEINNDIVYIVTSLFGITGGLITVLKFIIPRLVKFIRKKREEQQQPTTGNIRSMFSL
jgi:hypothetical protein